MSSNTYGERFLGRDIPAWHRFGTVFTGTKSAIDATKECQMDYEVVMAPAMAEVKTVFGTQVVPAVGKNFLVREPSQDDPEYRIFGVVGDDYKMIQNMELAAMLDKYMPEFVLETCSALDNGRTVFYLMRNPQDAEIKGDLIKNYFGITDTKNGKSSLQIAYTPIRWVCRNTLISGLKQASVKTSITHNNSMENEVSFRMDLLGKLARAQTETLDIFQKLADTIIKMPTVNKILEAAYPMPKKPAKVEMLVDSPEIFVGHEEISDALTSANTQWNYYCNLANTRRAEALGRLEQLNDEFPKIARTPWAVYNAVVENEDYRDGPESMYVSTIFGERAKAKSRAMEMAMKSL